MKKYGTVNVHIDADAYEAKRDGRNTIKVTLYYAVVSPERVKLGSFWIPMSTYDKGRDAFVEAIKARSKHDFKIILGHYSASGW